MKTYLMTGATGGLGHAAARALLASDPSAKLVIGARDPDDPRLSDLPQDRITALPLDMTRLSAVRSFARVAAQKGPLDGLAFNAGIQVTGGRTKTPDGIETDFAVNYLAHMALLRAIRPHLVLGARVVTTGSGTHDPNERIAKMLGFKGGRKVDAVTMAEGVGDDGAQGDRDRYATSKMAQIGAALALARRDPDRRWFILDPGLMPGTGLARDRGAAERFAWNHILPLTRFLLPGVSTATQSGAVLARMLMDKEGTETGTMRDWAGVIAQPADPVRDVAWQDSLLDDTEDLLNAS